MEFDPALIPFTLFVFILTGLAAGLVVLGDVCGPHRTNPIKAMPYESGVDPFHDVWRRFHVRYHVLAVTFLLFDVELLFLYPWAVALRQAAPAGPAYAQRQETGTAVASGSSAVLPATTTVGSPAGSSSPSFTVEGLPANRAWTAFPLQKAFWVGLIFIGLLALGYLYDWQRGIFDWTK